VRATTRRRHDRETGRRDHDFRVLRNTAPGGRLVLKGVAIRNGDAFGGDGGGIAMTRRT
jgi:hypothetical protein